VSDKLQKKATESIRESSQYALAFGLISTMLYVAGFPIFVIFFFAIFAYVLFKTFSQPSRSETREVFEFYLSANELLRDDERRWYGFEVQEVINRGERILQLMNGAPPLVYFTLGALYNKIGDHKSAVNHLAYVIENENADEAAFNYPSPDLRNYVRILRKIEREPAEAPQTSAAVRSLERARRNRGRVMLEQSRVEFKLLEEKKQSAALAEKSQKALAEKATEKVFVSVVQNDSNGHSPENGRVNISSTDNQPKQNGAENQKKNTPKQNEDPFANRKPISEVLHDIYDAK